MVDLFIILFLITVIATVVFLFKPALTQFKNRSALSRKTIAIGGTVLSLILLFIVGTLAPPAPKPAADDEIPQNTAPAVKPKVEKIEKVEAEPVPVKVEANLGMTPEQFRKKFNAQLKELNVDTFRPLAEFDIKKGNVRDVFQIMLTPKLSMTGTVNKDGQLREVTFVAGGGEDYQSTMMDLLIVGGVSAKVIQPNEEAGKELVSLITAALKNIDKEDNTHSKIIGDVKYYAIASNELGLWIGVSPKNDD